MITGPIFHREQHCSCKQGRYFCLVTHQPRKVYIFGSFGLMVQCPLFWARQILVKGWGNFTKRGEESGGCLRKTWAQPLSTTSSLLKDTETCTNSLAGAGDLSLLKAEAFVYRLGKPTQLRKGVKGQAAFNT